MMNKLLQHQLGQLNYYQSVERIYDINEKSQASLIGVKNVEQVPRQLVEDLVQTKRYQLHTLDAHALGGRAIDLSLVNPITGNHMSGSSSGTALNVFVGINDIGIGTDGGGSVLAPAMSLNLYSFISPLLYKNYMKQYQKDSTDNITFTPSLGFITRELDNLKQTVFDTLDLSQGLRQSKICVNLKDETHYPFSVFKEDYGDIYAERKTVIETLERLLRDYDVVISKEGPVDMHGFGDSIYGHFDDDTKKQQKDAKKGFIRVINMVGATALTIPSTELGCGYVLICRSTFKHISLLFNLAKKLPIYNDELISKYFGHLEMYFPKGYKGKEE